MARVRWPVDPKIRQARAEQWRERLRSESHEVVRKDWLHERESLRVGMAKLEVSQRESRLLKMRLATGESQLIKIGVVPVTQPPSPAETQPPKKQLRVRRGTKLSYDVKIMDGLFEDDLNAHPTDLQRRYAEKKNGVQIGQRLISDARRRYVKNGTCAPEDD